jgi:FAD/FMN-containing dehydrogenase
MKRRTFVRSTAAAAAGLAMPRSYAHAAVRPWRSAQPDVDAVTGDGASVRLSARALGELQASLRGRMLLDGDAGYDDARRILNPSFDKRPALIVQPTGVADVRTAVDFARGNGGLLLAVKCGGHSASGQSTCDRGMLIDLSAFRGVRVDPAAQRAWVAGGSLLGQVDHETMAFGLVTPLGTVSHTGVGGLVTGGGFGRVARRFGLSVDNLVGVDVVSADGQLHHASAQENPDLFWGVRGGGGNFGIVTSFEFRLHPMQRTVVAGDLVFPLARARDAFHVFADLLQHAPDELAVGFAMVQPPAGAPGLVAFEVCFAGPETDAERAIAPLRRLGSPLADNIAARDYVAVQRAHDVDDPRAMGVYLKSGFIADVPAALIAAAVDRFQGHPDRLTSLFFQASGGAIGRVPPDATAFVQRDSLANMLCSVAWPIGDDSADHVTWIRDYWSGLEPFIHGFYVNDLEHEADAAAIRANYRQNHDRLVAVKNRYDSGNLFRLNANVPPSV